MYEVMLLMFSSNSFIQLVTAHTSYINPSFSYRALSDNPG